MSKITMDVRIQRYQPESDRKPHWQVFHPEVDEEATVLDVLGEIHWKIDGTLAYRRSCRSAICGSCAMKVNGRNVLACETPASQFGTRLKIEPLPGFPILKDLVVDLEDFFAKLERIRPYLILKRPVPEKEFRQTPAQFDEIGESTLCILCAACTSSCPSLWPNP
ncbi:MAG TPA: 2Fe-2S iron-sulfur cluster-binding protein, partial [Candidatus Aminicenantes bacterium]|nr:2Fe-2S iron-sulfur cluster-binding protein [Candidatus Aminicenantes bacterium]